MSLPVNTTGAMTVLPLASPTDVSTAWWGSCPRCSTWFDTHRADCPTLAEVFAGAPVAVPNTPEVGATR